MSRLSLVLRLAAVAAPDDARPRDRHAPERERRPRALARADARARPGRCGPQDRAAGCQRLLEEFKDKDGPDARREPRHLEPHSRGLPAARRPSATARSTRTAAAASRRSSASWACARCSCARASARRRSATPGRPRTGSSTRCSTRSGSARTRPRAARSRSA